MVRRKTTPSGTKHSSPQSTSSTISLAASELPQRLAGLQKEHQWFCKQIKRKRTELNNLLEQIRFLATETFQHLVPLQQKFPELDAEIHALFNEVLSNQELDQQSREEIVSLYQTLQIAGIISRQQQEQEDQGHGAAEWSETEEASNHQAPEDDDPHYHYHHHHQTGSFPDPPVDHRQDLRKLRQTFIRLATIFHPDKATDEATAKEYTEIMKELNKAYQSGDFALLLEIEQRYEQGLGVVSDSSSDSELERLCQKIEQENLTLLEQYEKLKEKVRMTRSTPQGELVIQYRSSQRDGIDLVEKMVTEMTLHLQELEKMRDFVRDFRDQKITINRFLAGPPGKEEIEEEESWEVPF